MTTVIIEHAVKIAVNNEIYISIFFTAGLAYRVFGNTTPEYMNQHQDKQILTAVLVAQLLFFRFIRDLAQALTDPRILLTFIKRHIL